MRDAVILFTGDRRREEAAKSLPKGSLARIHEAIGRAVARLGFAQLFTVGDRLAGATRLPVAGDSLGGLVSGATESVFAAGYDRVLLLAGDVIGITTRILDDSFATLRRGNSRAVIGRSGDGGFYLVAFNACPEIDWSRIGWFTSTAADDLEALLKSAGFEVSAAPPVDDIDGRGDLERIARTSTSRRVRSLLRSLIAGTELRDEAFIFRESVLLATVAPRSPPAGAGL